MKPNGPGATGSKFPVTDYCYHAGMGEWRGYSSPSDGDDDSEQRKFNDFSRRFLLEAARERAREMAVFAIVVLASAWPMINMIIAAVRLLRSIHPLHS